MGGAASSSTPTFTEVLQEAITKQLTESYQTHDVAGLSNKTFQNKMSKDCEDAVGKQLHHQQLRKKLKNMDNKDNVDKKSTKSGGLGTLGSPHPGTGTPGTGSGGMRDRRLS
jgi:hypothetical protein